MLFRSGIREKIAESADDAPGSDGDAKKRRGSKRSDDREHASEAIDEALADTVADAPAEASTDPS